MDKKVKFLKININYIDMTKDFFNKYPYVLEKSYKEICNIYYNEFYWPANFLEKELSKLYGWECDSIIFPLENNKQTSIFFKKWCEYNNIESSLEHLHDRLLFQIAYYNPDIIYIHEIWHIPNNFLGEIKYLNPNIKIIGWNCAPASLNNLRNQKNIDNIFTCSKDIKKELLKNNFLNVTKTNHMFDKNILKNIKKIRNKKYDIVFFGVLYKSLYKDRIELLKSLLYNKFDIVIFGDTDDEELKKYCKPAIYGKELYRIIKQSKVVLNIHSNDSKFARNIRLFEVTGVGSLLISDYKPNMHKLFKEKVEAVTFKTYDEAIKLIKYYLENNEEREKIALNGQKRTLKDYTYKVLANKVYEFSKKEISIQERYSKLLEINKLDTSNKINFRDWSNRLINQTKELSINYDRIAIYGNGNVTKLIKEYIPNLIAVFDQNILNKDIKELKVYNTKDINNFSFDCIIITAFGYEDEITNYLVEDLKVDKNKIFIYKL